MSEVRRTPGRVLGGWQHAPTFVTVIGPGGAERRAEVRTHQHWAILHPERPHVVEWRVMFVLPQHIAPYPVVFEDVSEAKKWSPGGDAALELDQTIGSDWAADIRWEPPDEVEQTKAQRNGPRSLIFFSDYNGTGTDSYTVPAPPGIVSDWPGQEPASVPPWMPCSFETTDETDRVNLYGHNYGNPRCDKHMFVLGKYKSNLEFDVLDAACSEY